MLMEGISITTGGGGGGCSWSRVCDTCRSAACTVYCHADSAYLCSGCDARIHAANRVASRHERVRVCEACERAPAAFLCKADAASMCSSCDADIHSANPLASRHHRVPIIPISGCVFGEQEQGAVDSYEVEEEGVDDVDDDDEDEAEAASWLLMNDPVKNDKNESHNNGVLFHGEDDVDDYLDQFSTLEYDDDDDHHHQQHNYGYVPNKVFAVDNNSVVPVQNQMPRQQQQQQFQSGVEFDSSKAAFSYKGSVSQSVSISSMEVGIVPESTMSDVSISHPKPPNGTQHLFSGPPIQMSSYLTPIDREARVLRYREKKKTRKFEKKIRYASRKAYAETRPRIKGRFAKRNDVESDQVDLMFSSSLMTEAGYSVVPSLNIQL